MGSALKVAVIGAGYFSRFHLDGWHRNPDAALVAVADLAPEKAEALLRDLAIEGVAVMADAKAMLDEWAPDIVDIAAPPQAHLNLIRLALATKAKAIVCQKPFCGDLASARQAVAMAQAAGRLLIVNENFRFQPWYRRIGQEIAAGRLGRLYQVTFRLRPGDGRGPEAYRARQPYFQTMPRFLIHETGVHWIDTFRYLLGEPASVLADLRRLNPAIAGEDSGFFLYRFADGRRALFDGNRLADHVAENRRLTMGECWVEGEKATLMLDGDGRLWLRAHGSDAWEKLAFAAPAQGFGGDCVYALQRHVTDHLLHGGLIENEALAYLRNMEIEEAVYRAAESGTAVDLTQTAHTAGQER